jgi:hypothetical protein
MSTERSNQDGWTQWSKHVLLELERLSEAYEKLSTGFVECRNREIEEITKLKMKASIWGLSAGAIPVVIAFGIWAAKTIWFQ